MRAKMKMAASAVSHCLSACYCTACSTPPPAAALPTGLICTRTFVHHLRMPQHSRLLPAVAALPARGTCTRSSLKNPLRHMTEHESCSQSCTPPAAAGFLAVQLCLQHSPATTPYCTTPCAPRHQGCFLLQQSCISACQAGLHPVPVAPTLCATGLRMTPSAAGPARLTCTRSLLHHPRGRSCQATTRALITAEAATFIRKICSELSWCIRGSTSCSWATSASTQEASSRDITAAGAGKVLDRQVSRRARQYTLIPDKVSSCKTSAGGWAGFLRYQRSRGMAAVSGCYVQRQGAAFTACICQCKLQRDHCRWQGSTRCQMAGHQEGQLYEVTTPVAQQPLTDISARAAAGRCCACQRRLLPDHCEGEGSSLCLCRDTQEAMSRVVLQLIDSTKPGQLMSTTSCLHCR